MPRPPKPYVAFSQPVADRILRGLADGHGLRALCRGADMPTRPTVMRWLKQHPDFAAEVALCRFMGGLDRPGRPSLCREAVLEAIYQRLCRGEPLRTVCRDPDLPARSTVQAWALARGDVAHAVDLGRQVAAEQAAEQAYEAFGWGAWARARWAGASDLPPPTPPLPRETPRPAPPPGPAPPTAASD